MMGSSGGAIEQPPETYDALVAAQPSASDLLVWLKLADASDTEGTLTAPTLSGVTFDGPHLPVHSIGASAGFPSSGHISYPGPAALSGLTAGTIDLICHPDAGSLAGQTRGLLARHRTAGSPHTGDVGIWWTSDELIWELIRLANRPPRCRLPPRARSLPMPTPAFKRLGVRAA